MPLSDAKRRANNKYIAANMTVLGCKVRKDYAEKVREKAANEGTTVNAILKTALDTFMGESNETAEREGQE